jgi:hypothetical protein
MLPALVLPRLYADLSGRRVLASALLIRGAFAAATWLAAAGFYAVLAAWQSLVP